MTHRLLPGLVILLLVSATARSAPEAPVDALRAAMTAAIEAAQAHEWASAETAYREAARLVAERARAEPGNFDLAVTRDTLEYNAACAASLAGHVDAAFGLLHGLLDRSWYDNDGLLDKDPDLAALRQDPQRFEAVRARGRDIMAAATKGHAEGVILLPSHLREGARIPLVVALHGGGGSIEGWQDAGQPVADRLGAAVVLVRSTRRTRSATSTPASRRRRA